MINNDILEDVAVSTTGLTITDLHSTSYTRFVRNRWSGLRVSLIDLDCLGDKKNVIVVHCNSGKGRTGTAICAILLYMGFCNSIEDCLRFYGHRRFICGKGVS